MSLYSVVHKHYSRLPEWLIRGAGAIYYALPEVKRYGQDFQITRALLRETEYLPKAKIEELVNERFLHTVLYAYAHVPYYHKKYREHGVDPNAIKDVRDIALLPIMDKEDLRRHQGDLISDEYNRANLMYITTSGSTGNPVGFYQIKAMTMVEWAYTMHIWGRVGCTPDSSRLVLRGKTIHANTKDPSIFYDPLRRELSCDVFNMTEKNMERYCRAIETYKPSFVHGYMSAIVMLTKYITMRSGGLRHQFAGILATSENVVPEQKAYVERILGTRVFSFYGHSERLVIAGECEKSAAYHIEPLYGYCELLDGESKAAENGEIVATGFLNNAMPLIRYRTGDIASWETTKPCACGRAHLRLDGVHGRWNQDMLITAEGAYMSLTALNIHSEEFDQIVRYKLVQDAPGIVCMKIMPMPGYQARNGERIKALLEGKVNGKVRFDIQLVEDLPLLKNGKYQIIEQKLPIRL